MSQLKQRKHPRALFYSLLILMLGMCFLRYALQINFPRGILLALAVLIALLGDRDEIIAMCICCIPLYTSFHYFYALLFCILIYALKYGKTVHINLSVVPILMMMAWELLHCFGNPFSVVSFVSAQIPLILLALIMCCGDKKFDYPFITRALAICIAASCFLLLGKLVYLSGFNLTVAFANLQRLGLDSEEAQGSILVMGGHHNPNTLGIMCVLAITGLMQLKISGEKGKLDVLLIGFLILFGTMTTSRTYSEVYASK